MSLTPSASTWRGRLWSGALAAETLGTIEGWIDEEFFDRSTSDMSTRVSRDRRVEAQATVPALLRAELDRWTR